MDSARARIWLTGFLLVALIVGGCGRVREAEGGVQGAEGIPAAEPGGTGTGEVAEEAASEGAVPECDPAALASDGYKAVLVRKADLDGDGTAEYIIGYQFEVTDDIGEPKEIAYVALAKWDGKEWSEWFSIPAPDGEKYCDGHSLIAAEDMNSDGVVELVLRFYGFGISSRPENVYVWQVKGSGLESAAAEEPIRVTSDDAVGIEECDLAFPGKEIIFAIARPRPNEAHAAPHRYEIAVWGWSKGKYRKQYTHSPGVKFANADAALYAYTHGTDY